jgi:L-iditol 2-dehydrogenase
MKAALFRRDIPRYLLSRSSWSYAPGLWSPHLAPISLVEGRRPEPSRPGWVGLRVKMCGICGSDVHLVTGQESLYLEPEASYPFTPGHEIVAEVETTASDGKLPKGQRVAVWPVIGCRARDVRPLCSPCASGFDGLCESRDGAWPDRGLSIGFNRDTGGGWAESCLAHESQLWPLPDSLTDEQAVLLDPAVTALAALLRTETSSCRSTLIIGGGTIGLLAARLSVALDQKGCEILVRHPFQAALARERGLVVYQVRSESEFHEWATNVGLTSRHVSGYGRIYQGSYDRVIDTAGSASSLRWSLAATRSGGETVVVSGPPRLDNFDPTPLWYREKTLRGIYGYGPVPWRGRPCHPLEVLISLLVEGRLHLDGLITHHYPLGCLFQALNAAANRSRSKAVKVVLEPGGPAS